VMVVLLSIVVITFLVRLLDRMLDRREA
jgi:hypothetical protein